MNITMRNVLTEIELILLEMHRETTEWLVGMVVGYVGGGLAGESMSLGLSLTT